MKTQLQAVSLRIQTVRSNEQMMQSMKGATSLLGSMNRSMNLPALQRIAMDFERENDIMEQRQEMMDDAIDDVTGLDDEMESDEIVNQVLDEIGVEMNQSVSLTYLLRHWRNNRKTNTTLIIHIHLDDTKDLNFPTPTTTPWYISPNPLFC